MYNKKFDRVYLFSPSLGTIEDCPFEKLADDQMFDRVHFSMLGTVGGKSIFLEVDENPTNFTQFVDQFPVTDIFERRNVMISSRCICSTDDEHVLFID